MDFLKSAFLFLKKYFLKNIPFIKNDFGFKKAKIGFYKFYRFLIFIFLNSLYGVWCVILDKL